MGKKERMVIKEEKDYKGKKVKMEREDYKEKGKVVHKEKGSFGIDEPKRIISMKKIKDDPLILKCVVEWRRRDDGFKPRHSEYSNAIIKKYNPLLLINYYEEHLIFPKRKDKHSHK